MPAAPPARRRQMLLIFPLIWLIFMPRRHFFAAKYHLLSNILYNYGFATVLQCYAIVQLPSDGRNLKRKEAI
uniref:Secreted protein n=1 Tax=Globodera rostochiensis TaxID=31243 RepID=A0A914I6A5_GLORO